MRPTGQGRKSAAKASPSRREPSRQAEASLYDEVTHRIIDQQIGRAHV